MYKNEIEMYPDIINWLNNRLKQKHKIAIKINVLDTHNSDLKNFIEKLNYQKFFPEYSTYSIRQDITAFIEYEENVDLVFVECKNKKLNLSHLSQLIGYTFVALPIEAYLISPYGMGSELEKLLKVFNRSDILEIKENHKISILKWDKIKQDIDFNNSFLL